MKECKVEISIKIIDERTVVAKYDGITQELRYSLLCICGIRKSFIVLFEGENESVAAYLGNDEEKAKRDFLALYNGEVTATTICDCVEDMRRESDIFDDSYLQFGKYVV